MPVSKEQLASIIGGRAREMCSVENDKKFNAMAGRIGIDEDYFSGPDPDPYTFNDGGAADRFDAMCGFGCSDEEVRDFQYNQRTAAGSRMPDNIKQSMLNERIDTSKLGNTSILDSMSISPKKTRSTMNEQVYNPQPQQNQMGAGFDANYLKFIIKECLNEYFGQQPLNESVNGIKTIGLGKGYISIVDNKGDIYKAKLEKVGNKNDNKE